MGKRKYQKRHRESVEGFVGVPNLEAHRWMQERRRSSATQRHVLVSRKGSRRERERQAIRDQRRDLG